MINTKLLETYIENSGLRVNYIAETLGISDSLFRKKRSNKVDFKTDEIESLCFILQIFKDKEKVFFANV